jgi:uncharacterized membrane protein YeaQ/YmgE (transglycosylase-associated protein family)
VPPAGAVAAEILDQLIGLDFSTLGNLALVTATTSVIGVLEEEGTVEFTVVGIIMALVVGLIIGALGRLVVPGRQNMPMWLHMLIGVGAALLGTVIARASGFADTRGFDWREFLLQVLLAAIAVALVAGAGRRRGVSRY